MGAKLVTAVVEGNLADVKKCLASKGINVNEVIKQPDGKYESALTAMVRIGKADETTQILIADLLLKAGASPDVVDQDGKCSLHHVKSPMLMKLLVAAKPKLDIKDSYQNTPLQLAAYYGRVENCRCLVEAKADVTSFGSPM